MFSREMGHMEDAGVPRRIPFYRPKTIYRSNGWDKWTTRPAVSHDGQWSSANGISP